MRCQPASSHFVSLRRYDDANPLMGIALAEFLECIDTAFPPETAIDGDVTGLQLQAGRTEVSSVLVCLDVTEEVVEEAREGGYELLVSFHPLIFQPLRSLTEEERVGRLVTRLLQQRTALVVLHTRVDAHPEGTNASFAHALGLRVCQPLVPNGRYPGYGMGVIAEAEVPMEAAELLERIAHCVGQPLRYVPGARGHVRRVALVGGSGGSFLAEALRQGVDAFVTGDVKYHSFHQARGHLWLIDAGHAETERFAPEAIVRILKRFLPEGIRLALSQAWRSPLQWFQLRQQMSVS